MNGQNNISYIVNERFQVTCMALTLISLFVIFYFSYMEFRPTDDYPLVTSLTPHQLFELGGPAKPIRVGLFLKSFSDFDIIKGKFLADLTIWFKFNPDFIPLDQIDQFVFQKAEIQSKSGPFLRIEGNDFVASYTMNVLFYVALNYKKFPLDDHRLSLIVDNYFMPPTQGFFVSSKNDIVVSPEAKVEGLKFINSSVSVGYFEHKEQIEGEERMSYHPRAIFLFDFAEAGVRYIFSIFLPLLMIFFTALFSFSIDPVEATTFSVIDMSGASLAALIAFRFVMESGSPAPGYFMISDYIFLFFLVVILFIFLVNI